MFNFQNFFNRPAVLFDSVDNQKFVYRDETVEFDFNSYGYRTYEFDNVGKHVVVAGCSHTEGHGLHATQTWVSHLEQLLGIKTFNLGKGSSSADFVGQVLQNWISVYSPDLVIAQWPNPYRSLSWNNGQAVFDINSNHSNIYRTKLGHGIENFYQPWCKNILHLNQVCDLKQIPIINMCLEGFEIVSPALSVLKDFGIELHYDEKIPNKTWHFDSGALDQMHHSVFCHAKWAERLLTISQTLL